MFDPTYWLVSTPKPAAKESFAVYEITFEFSREVQQRQAFDAYCQWYEQTAMENRRDLQQMRREINILGWFHSRS